MSKQYLEEPQMRPGMQAWRTDKKVEEGRDGGELGRGPLLEILRICRIY